MELLERYSDGRHRPLRLPGLARQPPDRRRAARGRPRAPRRPRAASSGRRTSTSRSSATGSPSRSRSTRRSSGSRGRWAAAWSRPPTSTTCGARTTTITLRCCACRRSRRSPRRRCRFDTNEFYLKSSQEMAAAFADFPEALASTLEIAERCDVSIELGGQLIPRFETPDGESERDYLRALVTDGLRRRYGDPIPADAQERADMELGVIDRMGFNAYFLIVHDFVALREVERHRGRPGPRLGGRLDRRVLPGDHRRRPAPLRPPLRALPERRARVDARHRHRLLGPRPRARDPLRDGQVRRRSRRPDHHLRQDVPARGHARRGARARPRVRDRRPARKADPGPAAGAAAELRRLPGARARSWPTRSRRTRRPSRSSTSRRASRASSATRRSMRRRSSSPTAALTDIVPLQLADAGVGRGRREGLPHGHAVLDEADRGDRPAQDGLPRPAQPRRHRGRAGHRRALDRHAAGHDDAAARRRARPTR